jgi:hypothetical protein
MRPTCDRLIAMPLVVRNTVTVIVSSAVEELVLNTPQGLLGTIKLPRNLNLLANQLPAP